jgi:hypothetical protein
MNGLILFFGGFLLLFAPFAIWKLYLRPDPKLSVLMPGGIKRLRRANLSHTIANCWPLVVLMILFSSDVNLPTFSILIAIAFGFLSQLVLSRWGPFVHLWADAKQANLACYSPKRT